MRRRWLPPLLATVWVLALALFVAGLLALVAGATPREVLRQLFAGTWGSWYGVGQVLFKATPLLLTGLSFSIAQRAGLFNIGIEGQLLLGALGMAIVGAALPAGTPAWLALPLCLLVGALAGAVWASIAGLLKAYSQTHEVLSTILLTFIAHALILAIGQHVYVREQVHTAPIAAAAELARIEGPSVALRLAFIDIPARPFHGSPLNGALLVALAVTALFTWLFARTSLGFRLRTLGAAPQVAATTGLSLAGATLTAMALSGAVAGVAGANFVLGYKHYFEAGFSGGVGYLGIAVAVLGGERLSGLLLAALLFGTLAQGAFSVNGLVPKELADVTSALLILALLVARPLSQRAARLLLEARP